MRWIAFLILIYVATVFQTTVAPFIAIHGVRPDVLIIVAVYYALMAARYDAFIAAWMRSFTGNPRANLLDYLDID